MENMNRELTLDETVNFLLNELEESLTLANVVKRNRSHMIKAVNIMGCQLKDASLDMDISLTEDDKNTVFSASYMLLVDSTLSNELEEIRIFINHYAGLLFNWGAMNDFEEVQNIGNSILINLAGRESFLELINYTKNLVLSIREYDGISSRRRPDVSFSRDIITLMQEEVKLRNEKGDKNE